MIRTFLTSILVTLSFAAAPVGYAQDMLATDQAIRAHAESSLPAWWQLQRFQISDVGGEELFPVVRGKGVAIAPLAPASDSAAGKGEATLAPLPVEQVVRFTARIALSEEIFEPAYSVEGTAIVTGIMSPGMVIDVTGALGLAGSGDEVQFGALMLDQGGLELLGKPLDAFDQPAFVEGSDEATAFLDAQSAARAEGAMNKLMSDEGEEL